MVSNLDGITMVSCGKISSITIVCVPFIPNLMRH